MSPRNRGIILAIVVAVHGFAALPIPQAVNPSMMESPVAIAESERWSEILSRLGIQRDAPTLRADTMRISKQLSSARKKALSPFSQLFRYTGTGQGWGFFNTPDAYPDQLRVEADIDGQWVLLYAALSKEADFLADKLTYRRVRGVYDGNTDRPGDSYNHMVDWIADETFTAFPDAKRVRVSFVRTHTTVPGVPPDDMSKARLKRLRKRSQP